MVSPYLICIIWSPNMGCVFLSYIDLMVPPYLIWNRYHMVPPHVIYDSYGPTIPNVE